MVRLPSDAGKLKSNRASGPARANLWGWGQGKRGPDRGLGPEVLSTRCGGVARWPGVV